MTRYLRATGRHYAIASGCPQATATAAAILDDGGNIIDAAIAGSAVQCVTSPHLVSIGGDLLCVARFSSDSHVIALNAVGRAPRRADIGSSRRLGHSLVPVRGPLSVQTPGLVAGWQALHRRWATRPSIECLGSALAHLIKRGREPLLLHDFAGLGRAPVNQIGVCPAVFAHAALGVLDRQSRQPGSDFEAFAR
jgi:gamma-glutamyltranspeptidase